mmetsp:Transcript_8057/g.21867  ORF Transcript_8057/g.21867 Transcript_8057/m.21867 type:complete len:276 (-) Transcript_8057:215-1042(-)
MARSCFSRLDRGQSQKSLPGGSGAPSSSSSSSGASSMVMQPSGLSATDLSSGASALAAFGKERYTPLQAGTMSRLPAVLCIHCPQSAPNRKQAVLRASFRTSLSPPLRSVCVAASTGGPRAAEVLSRAKRTSNSRPRASLVCRRCVCSAALRARTSSSAACWPLSCSSRPAMRAAALSASACASSRKRATCACNCPAWASLALRHSSLYLASTSAFCRSCLRAASSASKLLMRSALSAPADAVDCCCCSSCLAKSSFNASRACRRCSSCSASSAF